MAYCKGEEKVEIEERGSKVGDNRWSQKIEVQDAKAKITIAKSILKVIKVENF